MEKNLFHALRAYFDIERFPGCLNVRELLLKALLKKKKQGMRSLLNSIKVMKSWKWKCVRQVVQTIFFVLAIQISAETMLCKSSVDLCD